MKSIYKGGGGRTEKVQVRYRADDGSWQTQTRTRGFHSVPTQTNSSGSSSNTASANINNSAIGSPGGSVKGSAQGIANREYIEHEFFTLQGDCSVMPTLKSVQIKAGDTVNCLGLGKYLSGKYFVDEVTRSIDNGGGYSHSISVQKNGFGGSLKSGPNVDDRPCAVSKEVQKRIHVVVAGETLRSIALFYYGSAWYYLGLAIVNRIDENSILRVGQELIIP